MTDFDYEVYQRSKIARAAKYRKRGSKSKKCNLSTDNMTQKQWKERNGAIMTCNLKEPITFENFKRMSTDTQQMYITNLIDLYNVTGNKIAEMFGIHYTTLKRALAGTDVIGCFSRGKRMSPEQEAAWNRFLSSDEAKDDANKNMTQEVCNEVDAPVVTEELATMHDEITYGTTIPCSKMKQFSICFEGKIDVNMISNSIMSILGRDAVGKIEITCTL